MNRSARASTPDAGPDRGRGAALRPPADHIPPGADLLFREVQPLHDNVIVRVAMPMSLITLFGVGAATYAQAPAGQRAELIIVILAVVLFEISVITGLRQVTALDGATLTVRWLPFARVRIPAEDIVSAEAITYDPINDCGGWGPKRSKKHGRVFNVSGDRGVLVRLTDGSSMLIGSKRSEELAALLDPAGMRTIPTA